MTIDQAKSQHYRFGPRDRTGWLLGLQAPQCVALGAGVFAAGVLLNVGAPMPVVLVPLLAASGFAFARWDGHSIHELAPVAIVWALARALGNRVWFADLPRFARDGRAARPQPDWPPPLAGIAIEETTDARWTRRGRAVGAGVVHDRRERTLSAALRVRGREFSLCERAEQERLLHLWGDALAAFCAERGPVGRVRWTEWAAPAGLDDQFEHLAELRPATDETAPVHAYRELLEQAGPMATRHEVLVTVTIDERRLRSRRRDSADQRAAAEEALMDEVRLLTTRLDGAGLAVDPPLSPQEVAHVIRAHLDPYGAPEIRSGGRRSLVEHAGLVSVSNAGPLAVETAWDHVRVGGSCHTAYVVAEWPRLEVPPAWMEPLFLHAGGIRTVALHYEPVAPSRSKRQIDRETVKLSSDEEQRTRSGFRVGARHRRAQTEVLEREAELVAGYGEFEFVGFLAVTAPGLDELKRSCAEFEQAAAQAGLELRRLDGRHDLALACTLPIGRGIAPRRFA